MRFLFQVTHSLLSIFSKVSLNSFYHLEGSQAQKYLQEDLHEMIQELTNNCNMEDQVLNDCLLGGSRMGPQTFSL